MTVTPHQPTLPLEGAFTEAEINFLEESPPSLFPENQNSNFGYVIRKLFSDQMQTAIEQIETLYNEKFIGTASAYLSLWEQDYGLPVAPTGKTTAERRAIIESRIATGPFTRDRVKQIIEKYLNATQGTTIALTPDGVPIVSGGIPLYGEFTSTQAVYRVYEDIRNFTYTVWILNTITPDIAGMTRELQRITPSGIQFTIDNTKTNVLSYEKTILNKQPVGYWRMPNFVGLGLDYSGYNNPPTAVGGTPTEVVGLLNAAVAAGTGYNPHNALDFNNSNQYLSIPNHALYSGMPEVTAEAWIRLDVLPPTDYGMITNMNNSWQMRVGSNGYLGFWYLDIASNDWYGFMVPGITVGNIFHVVGLKRGDDVEIYINGVRQTNTLLDPGVKRSVLEVSPGPLMIGGQGVANTNFDGVIDEVAIYNYALSPAQILENYRTGKNLA